MQMTTEAVRQTADSYLSQVEEILSAVAMERMKGNEPFDPVVVEQLKKSREESYELLRTVSPLNEDGEIELGEDA